MDEISVNIIESKDGDYYEIDPEIKGYGTFVDYIESMYEDIRAYMVMHELCLKEVWVDSDGVTHSEITHKEFHIIDINDDDEKQTISERFDAKIKYRPICMKSGSNYSAIIIDTIKIINTVDSSSYEVTGSLEISNPHKYGKNLKRLAIKNDSRPIINVYNKKVVSGSSGSGYTVDSNTSNSSNSSTNSGGVIVVNNGGVGAGFVVENMTQNITSFIECTNIGVSIVELSPDDIK